MSSSADKPVRHILSISGGKDSSALTKLFTATGIVYVKGPDLLTDARAIIDAAQASAYRAVNVALVYRNWLLGRRIAEEDLGGKDRAEYGSRVVTSLAEQLTGIYGDGFDRRSLYMFLQFYRRFPIVDSLSPQSGGLLSWTHYRKLLQVESDNPTLGIILCADTDSDIARYSMLHGSEQLFASKYKLLLPTEEELRAEIEAQKTFWIEQHGNAESIKEVRS